MTDVPLVHMGIPETLLMECGIDLITAVLDEVTADWSTTTCPACKLREPKGDDDGVRTD